MEKKLNSQTVVLVNISEEDYTSLSRELLIASCEIKGTTSTFEHVVQIASVEDREFDALFVGVESESDLHLIRKLSGRFLNTAIVAVTKTAGEPKFILELLRAGASKVLPSPCNQQDLTEILQDIALHHRANRNESVVIGVTSEQNGVGSTTIAVNLAYEIATQHEKSVAIIEIPDEFSTLPIFLGLEQRWGLQDLIALADGPDRLSIERTIIRFDQHLAIIPASQKPRPISLESFAEISEVVRHCQALFDVVVLDASVSDRVLQSRLLRNSNFNLLVTRQCLPSLNVISQCIDDKSLNFNFGLVVNEYDQKLLPLDTIKKYLGIESIYGIRKDSSSVSVSISAGKPIRLICPESHILDDLHQISAEVMGQPSARERPLLSRLSSFFYTGSEKSGRLS